MRKILEEGVDFQSHIDGSRHRLGPEKAVELQRIIGSDIQMQLDVCSPWDISYKKAEEALRINNLWLDRSCAAWKEAGEKGYRGKLFAIVQGNLFKDLRERSARAVVEADTPGIAIGGLSVGEPEERFLEFLAYTSALLPEHKPRDVMGIGTPQYILAAIEQGIDMFDCVLPTRTGRNGHVFTRNGPFNLKKAENRVDFEPIDKECQCAVCRQYSRAYLRHLFKTQEILCSMLASYHNLYFLQDLVAQARSAIAENRFVQFKRDFLAPYGAGKTGAGEEL
jgi:queuine tRNA-ribosyltransferase